VASSLTCSRGDSEQQAGALLTHHWQNGASDVRAEQQRVELMAHLFWAQLLEEASEEVARVVDEKMGFTLPLTEGSV
jgi:hypothetical protein